jgi:outer membrane protein TolC
LRHQQDLARLAKEIKEGEYQPEIAAFAKYELHPDGLSALEPHWVIGIKGQVTLFKSGATRAGIQAAQHQEKEIRLLAQHGKIQLQSLSAQTLANTKAQLGIWESAALRIELATENYRILSKRYAASQATDLEVNEALVQLHHAKFERVQMAAAAWDSALEACAITAQIPLWLQWWQGA